MIQEMTQLTLNDGSKVMGRLAGYDRPSDSYLVKKTDDSLVMISLEQIKKREYVLTEVHVNR